LYDGGDIFIDLFKGFVSAWFSSDNFGLVNAITFLDLFLYYFVFI
jgi:hypothetical protein